MTLHIATGANAAYTDKIRPYLETLDANGGTAHRWLICVNCDPPAYLEELGSVRAVPAGDEQLVGSPPDTDCLQHGAFVEVLPAADDDVIIYTDGDIFLQRPLDESERAALYEWPHDAIGVSYNAGPRQTLLHEALFNLRPKVGDGAFLDHWGRHTVISTAFNAGVLVGRRSTFEKVLEVHRARWPEINRHLDHHARQQWLISWVLATGGANGVKPQVMTHSFHMHAHYQLPPGGLYTRSGDAYYDGKLVAFWHLPMWRRK